ncbi:MAG TPA: flagellar type III secretion system pore protein FliP [Azospirillaceae bacterium]|nr:flagellar type III secretion system pore protein FliP [Azospirillaceae bacterium]
MIRRIAFALLAVAGVSASLAALLWTAPAVAQTLTLDLGQGGGSTTARVIQMLVLMTVLSLAPSILIMVTSFTRIVIVLSFLRSAMGIQQTPPNTVMVSLALFLTLFIMSPVLETIYRDSFQPLLAEDIQEEEALQRALVPIESFMLRHTREQDLNLFLGIARMDPPEKVEDTPIHILIPAFMISELRRAFEIGFLLFIPFLIIDMVVASVLMSMGMMMLPPAAVALPFKIIFFVLVDGWYLIIGSLVQSFNPG